MARLERSAGRLPSILPRWCLNCPDVRRWIVALRRVGSERRFRVERGEDRDDARPEEPARGEQADVDCTIR